MSALHGDQICGFLVGGMVPPTTPADQEDHPATRFHQEKIPPPDKKRHANFGHIGKSWDMYLCYFTALFIISTAWPGLSIDSMSGITIFWLRRKKMELEAILPIEVLQDCWWYLGCIFHAFEGLQNQARIILLPLCNLIIHKLHSMVVSKDP